MTFVWIRIGASVKTSVLFRAYETSYAARESKRARRARESVLGRDAKRRRGVGDLVGGVREGVAGIGDPRARRVAVGREGARPVAPGNVEGGAAGVRDAHEGGDASLGGDAPRGDAASGGDGHVVSRGGGGCAAGLEFGGEEDVGDASVALAVGAGDVVGVLAAGLGDEAGDGGGHGIGEVRRGEEGAHERVRGGEGRTPEQGDAEQGDAARASACRLVRAERSSSGSSSSHDFCAPSRRPTLLATARRGAGAAPSAVANDARMRCGTMTLTGPCDARATAPS